MSSASQSRAPLLAGAGAGAVAIAEAEEKADAAAVVAAVLLRLMGFCAVTEPWGEREARSASTSLVVLVLRAESASAAGAGVAAALLGPEGAPTPVPRYRGVDMVAERADLEENKCGFLNETQSYVLCSDLQIEK